MSLNVCQSCLESVLHEKREYVNKMYIGICNDFLKWEHMLAVLINC